MYDNNDNYMIDVSYTSSQYSPEPEIVKPAKATSGKDEKNKGASKLAVVIIIAALVGGISGFGGTYIANNMDDEGGILSSSSLSDAFKSKPDILATTETAADNAFVDKLNIPADPYAAGRLSTPQVIDKASPSVVSIAVEFSNGSGGGTGIILTTDGYIVTNAHVVKTDVPVQTGGGFGGFFGGGGYTTQSENASTITVYTSDEKEYKAKLIGTDTGTDLAVLKISASNLVPAEIGDSNMLILGEKAIALGYPLDLGLCASDGIVSGLNKSMYIELVGGGSGEMTLIQTNAAINPGNSGGPLINEWGQVIGITSSKLVYSSIEGIGFAIPISDAMPILQELIDNGFVKDSRPKLGIMGKNVSEEPLTQRYFGIEKGVIVDSVEEKSAAAKAGLKEGDIIIAAEGDPVDNMEDLLKIRDRFKAGDKMTVTIIKSDGNVDIEITLGGYDN